jgi:transposase
MEEITVVIGIDAHKRTHTLVVADELGRELAQKTVAATTDGHLVALEWASRWPGRRWAVEDCRHLTRTLERDLISAGKRLVRVPTKLMAGTRRSAREAGKSDPIDALSVARAAWREPDLPTAHLDGPQRELRLLVDHRDDLVRERTRIQSRIRWHLHELDPELHVRSRGLRSQRVVDGLDAELATRDGLLASLARELLARVRELNHRALELEHEIRRVVIRLAPSLLDIPGCGALTAAKTPASDGFAPRAPTRAGTAPPSTSLVGQPRPLPPYAQRQPPGQRRAAPHRDHPGPPPDRRTRLHRAANSTRQHQDRGTATAATAPL